VGAIPVQRTVGGFSTARPNVAPRKILSGLRWPSAAIPSQVGMSATVYVTVVSYSTVACIPECTRSSSLPRLFVVEAGEGHGRDSIVGQRGSRNGARRCRGGTGSHRRSLVWECVSCSHGAGLNNETNESCVMASNVQTVENGRFHRN